MKFFRLFLLLALTLTTLSAQAQFYVTGDDPGSKKWMQIETEQFKVIYPEAIDSLAHVYARNLERYKMPVSFSTRYYPGEKNFCNKKMPVVLHAWNAFSNGSVAWAPKRMDLFTIPSAYGPEAIPWSEMLAIHESRHVTQMQYGLDGWFKAGDFFFGEMFNILSSLFWTGTTYMEGDAVITETALTKGGRGRNASFLQYYMVAGDHGIERDWYQWKEKSQRQYAPNYYALGYLTLGGFRYFWDQGDIMDQYYSMLVEKPLRCRSLNHRIEQISGMKFKDVFKFIYNTAYSKWAMDAEARKPYIQGTPVSAEPSIYTDYSDLVFTEDRLFAIRSGFQDAGTLVEILPDRKEKYVSNFAPEVGMLYHSPATRRLYWSETVPDERWSLKSESKIRYMDLDHLKKKKNLTRKELLYNPIPSPTERHIATTEYTVQGRSRLVILDGKSGEREHVFQVPDSLQLMEAAWIGDRLYASALSHNGYGLYRLDITLLNRHDRAGNPEAKAHEEAEMTRPDWHMILPPQPAIIRNLSGVEEDLLFSSDRTGANEFYRMNPETGRIIQLTSTRYGVTQGTYSPDLKDFYYTAITLKGNMIYRIPADSLQARPVRYSELYSYPIADRLSEQEKSLSEENHWKDLKDEDIEVSRPKRYRKVPHLFNMHSWTPVYVDVKNIMEMSYDHWYDLASLGVAGIMQNQLSTARGSFGYSAHKDPYDRKAWRHSGHLKFTYSGLYPVFELALDLNDRAARQYRTNITFKDNGGYLGVMSYEKEQPYFSAALKTYIPWNFSSGGWYRGVIPQLSYTFTNDSFDSRPVLLQPEQHGIGFNGGMIRGYGSKGKNRLTHHLSTAIRAYSVMSTPNSCVYPRWGIGAEIGANFELNRHEYFSHMGFAYLYGYLPGFVRKQGFKLTAMWQHNFKERSKTLSLGSAIVNTLPRGLASRTDILSDLSMTRPDMVKFSVDYGIPIYIGDLHIWKSFISIKRMEINPHFDFMMSGAKDNFWSAGASLIFQLHTLIWIPWPCAIGVTYSYNGGSLFKKYSGGPDAPGHHFVGPVFSVSFP